jgi:hypothetical protein
MLSVLAFLVVMTMATSAFAQVGIYSVFPDAESRGRLHGYGEEAGSITFLLQPPSGLDSPASSDTITITFGARIANSIPASGAAADTDIDVDVCNNDNADATDMTGGDPNQARVSVSGSKLTIRLEGSTCNSTNPIIDVSGVRLSLAGEGQDSIMAQVSSGGDVRLVGDSEFTVISSVVDELTDDGVNVKPKVTLLRHTGEPKSDTEFKLMLTENTVDSFANTEIDLEFMGIPDDEDVSVVVDAWVITEEELEESGADGVMQVPLNDDQRMVTLDADQNETTVTLNMPTFMDDETTTEVDEGGGMLNGSKVDVIIIVGSIKGLDDDDKLPLGDIDIQVVANIGPGSRSDATTRFSSDPTMPVTVIESAPDRDTMTFSLAISNGTFDTGIAIINTGKDLTGPLTFAFYNMDGTMTTHTTSAASPGRGLTGGMLAPKSTYIVLLSEMMSSAFTGHIVVTTDFTGAVGTGYITDFSGFSSAVNVN